MESWRPAQVARQLDEKRDVVQPVVAQPDWPALRVSDMFKFCLARKSPFPHTVLNLPLRFECQFVRNIEIELARTVTIGLKTLTCTTKQEDGKAISYTREARRKGRKNVDEGFRQKCSFFLLFFRPSLIAYKPWSVSPSYCLQNLNWKENYKYTSKKQIHPINTSIIT